MNRPTAINHAVQTADEWLRDLGAAHEEFADRERGYAALRAVLHHLRDRLTVEEAAQLGAQLPTLIRGVYFGSWKPSRQPVRERHAEQFIDAVMRELNRPPAYCEEAVRAVFGLLGARIPAGEIEDVKHMLPEEVRRYWQ